LANFQSMKSNSTDSIFKMRIGIWNTFPKFLLINLGIALLLILIFCPTCFLTWKGIKSVFPDFLYSLAITMGMSYGGNVVENYYDRRISWIQHPVKRLVMTVGTYLTYAFIVSFTIVLFYAWVNDQIELNHIPFRSIAQNATLPMYIALVIMALFTTRSWLIEWKKSATEAAQLKSEQLSRQYQSLKDQLNPHFLFNSLNVLTTLVYEDADKSAEFIQRLSKIYRYVLEVQNEELVPLERELSFARNYLDLYKVRFGESLKFILEVDDHQPLNLPPLSLQLLLENAIKHNITSSADPLQISIEKKDDELWITNTFQPKLTQEIESTGVGLDNIKKRYSLISDRKIIISHTENSFIVILPLLQIEQ